jgi:hypothetical protein
MSTENVNNNASVEIENIDDFLPLPGADEVVTSSEEAKPNLFTNKQRQEDLTFLDNEDEEDDKKGSATAGSRETTNDVLDDLDNALKTGEESEEDDKKTPGRKKTDKSGLVDFLKKRIEKNEMFTFDDFDDEKESLDDYLGKLSEKDIEALWEENIKAMKDEVASQTPKEFFNALPEEMQKAAKYIADGGKDLKGLFRSLAQVQEYRELNPADESDQETIVRQYLYATQFGDGDRDLIEDQIQEWYENGTISKRANQFKPKLDSMQEQILEQKLAQQEEFKKMQAQKKEEYMENIYNTLKPAELNGVKLDSKRQKFLWDELTTAKYQSMKGTPTNMLGKLLEDYQFGKEPRYDLIAETLWLLSDPEDYKENIRKQVANEVVKDTVKKLKTEEAHKISSSSREQEDNSSPRRKISKPTNIFARR